MSRIKTASLSSLLSFAVFCAIFAVGSVLSPQGKWGIAALSLTEACAAFGGVCTMRRLSSRLSCGYDGGEYEIVSDGEPGEDTESSKKAVFPNILSAVFRGIICAVVLFCGNLLYSRYVYGNSAAPDLPLGAAVFFLGIIIPLAEETFFRGCILPCLTSAGIPRTAAVLLSSAAFAIIHDVRVMPFAFFAGVCLGITALIGGKGSSLPAFLAHAIYNTALCVIGATLV